MEKSGAWKHAVEESGDLFEIWKTDAWQEQECLCIADVALVDLDTWIG